MSSSQTMAELPEASFQAVAAVVSDELFARIAVRDAFETNEEADGIAELMADVSLTRFQMRDRRPKLTGDQ